MAEYIEDRSVFDKPVPDPESTTSYGVDPDQVIDFYGRGDRTIVLIHGGYWKPEYDRVHLRNFAEAISQLGFRVALIEYRRIPGNPDAMIDDVKRAIESLGGPVTIIGHSAGGHLALWAAANLENIEQVIALSPVTDVALCYELGLDENAAKQFLGTSPENRRDLDPMYLSLRGHDVTIIFGALDIRVPRQIIDNYLREKERLGQALTYLEFAEIGHFEVIDSQSIIFPKIVELLAP